jgi:thiamine kinase-like enzyme
MIWFEDHTKVTLIDFEYSSLNYRGYDIAAYVNECFIDYSYPVKPKFKIYEDQMLSYLRKSHDHGSEFDGILRSYLTKYHELTDSSPSKRNVD